MEFFRRLGDDLTARWRARGNREEEFPAIAADHNAPSHVRPAEILDWVLQADALPYQEPSEIDLALTLYWSERFAIYALFWVDGTTLIHDHDAWGAFQVLAGSSLHTTFSFDESERVTSCVALGELKLRKLETLRQGDVREVAVGRAFIHSLFHLDRPSVTIAIFTKSPAVLRGALRVPQLRVRLRRPLQREAARPPARGAQRHRADATFELRGRGRPLRRPGRPDVRVPGAPAGPPASGR